MKPVPPNKAYIAIGSNVGNRLETCQKAIACIKNIPNTFVTKQSSLIETTPIGVLNQPLFLNGVIEIETELSPLNLLRHLKEIERKLGRVPTQKWGPRTIDLDILFFGDEQITTQRLTIPHPRLHERWFVLKPLSELDGNRIHPGSKKTIKELLLDYENR